MPGSSTLRAFFGRDGPAAPVLIVAAPGAWPARSTKMLAQRAQWRARQVASNADGLLSSLDERRRSRLRCIVGPGALAVRAELPGARTCAVLRHPPDLVADAYHRAKAERLPQTSGEEELLELLAALPLDRVYERFAEATPADGPVHESFAAYCNPQARVLLAAEGTSAALPFTAAPPADARQWRDRLRAVVDRLDVIAGHDAMEPAVVRLTGLPDGPPLLGKDDAVGVAAAQLLPAAADAVRAYNWLDLELYERAAPDEPKRMRGRRLSGLTGGHRVELLFDSDGNAEQHPVGVFMHLKKTGGSSLKRMLRASLPHARDERLWTPHRPGSPATVLEWYRDLAAELGPRRLGRLRFCSSHTANFLLPHLDENVVAICIVRDAVDRVVSHYAFDHRSRDVAAGLAEAYETYGGASPRESTKVRKQRMFFNYQSRVLLAPEVDVDELPYSAGPPADADRWREALFAVANRYLIGTTERFADAARRFGAATGVELGAEVHEKVNPHRPRVAELDASLVEEIRAYNWLDAELHAAFATDEHSISLHQIR